MNDGMPYYVVKKNLDKNIVYVSKNLNHEAIWTKELGLRDVFMRTKTAFSSAGLEFSSTSYAGTRAEPSLRDEPVRSGRNIRVENSNQNLMLQKKQFLVRLRHRAPLVPAEFDGETLHFENEIKRPASGQSAVLYNGEACLGGGVII